VRRLAFKLAGKQKDLAILRIFWCCEGRELVLTVCLHHPIREPSSRRFADVGRRSSKGCLKAALPSVCHPFPVVPASLWMFTQSSEADIAKKQSRETISECLFLRPPMQVQIEHAVCFLLDHGTAISCVRFTAFAIDDYAGGA
jgi:hypothetical protein